MQIPDIRKIAKKWKTVTPGRQSDYIAGVTSPRRDWADSTAESEPLYVAGVQAAIARGAFGIGVRNAGTRKWQENTLAKGPSRWAQGVQLAEDDYARGFGPYRDLIDQLVLPPRGLAGSPENIERVRILTDAMHALKLELG